MYVGNAIAKTIRNELKERIDGMEQKPGLAVVLVGDRKDSQTYVRMKKRACVDIGMNSFGFDFPTTITQEELLAKGE